jgi:hypothetical protein
VSHIAVSENDLVDRFLTDQSGQVLFGVDRDALGIKSASQFWRVIAPLDVGDLRGSESDHFVIWVLPEINVEVVEITPCGAHDQRSNGRHIEVSLLIIRLVREGRDKSLESNPSLIPYPLFTSLQGR